MAVKLVQKGAIQLLLDLSLLHLLIILLLLFILGLHHFNELLIGLAPPLLLPRLDPKARLAKEFTRLQLLARQIFPKLSRTIHMKHLITLPLAHNQLLCVLNILLTVEARRSLGLLLLDGDVGVGGG